MRKIFLRKNISPRIAYGHPWIFKNEIGDEEGIFNPGDIVHVFSSNGSFVGKGYFNPYSQIRIRLLSKDIQENINDDFFLRKIKTAQKLRERLGFRENYRLIYSEADGLPGLTIDKFNDYFVIQIATLGMERWKNSIVHAIKNIYNPKGIFERSDLNVRLKEGLQPQKGFLSEPFNTRIQINENSLVFFADIENGTKTGFFLDQLYNKQLLKNIVPQANVLDMFSYTGAFAVHAAYYGARNVLGIEANEQNMTLAKENVQLNGYSSICSFECANPFDAINKLSNENKKFDVVILNPPPMATNAKQVSKALTAYKELNLRAIKLLRKGGYLLTISSSNVVSETEFKSILKEAAFDVHRKIVQITYSTQSNDHPIVWHIPETQYLKCFLLMVE